MHPSIASKPNPPPQSLKPKPSLPKKPAVASKPTSKIFERKLSQNGQEPPAPSSQQSQKPAVPDKAAIANQSSPTPASQKTISPRPKEPPPPLPKTSPKGSVVNHTPPSIHRTPPPVRKTPPSAHQTPPSAHKTPPPIPKTTPRVSVKRREDSPDLKVKGNESGISVTEAHSKQTCDTQTNCEDSKTVPNNKSENNKEDFTFDNLKSKFVSSKNDTKVLPKIPTKPKPLPKDISSKSIVKQARSGSSKSKWFIEEDSPEKDKSSKPIIETEENPSPIQFLRGNQSFSESTVWFNKSDESPKQSPKQSPKHSPAVPRKPPPRPPPKAYLSRSTESLNNNKNDNYSSSSEDSPIKQSEKQCDVDDRGNPEDNIHAFQKQLVNDLINAENDIDHSAPVIGITTVKERFESKEKSIDEKSKSERSPKPAPKPIPRKPTPAVRPRPTPRKRLSINRLSGTEETFENQTDSGKNNNDILNDKGDHDTKKEVVNKTDFNKNDVNIIEGDSSDKNGTDAKLRTFVSDDGEEQHYRAIDKRVARSQSHITELENEAEENTVILRKKTISREENVSDEELTIEQLKSIEHLLEGSDDEDTAHKFVPKVDLTVNDTNEDETQNKSVEYNEKNEKRNVDRIKDDFDDLDDKALLEPTSLLNEIEDILTRSFKHSSLTRSGSSPEKKSSPYLQVNGVQVGRAERSKSVDHQSTPVRPPRPKKEQKRLRSMSQVIYDSCGSDTESLPDLSRNRNGSLLSNCANISLTLGKAKPHPPKPKRNKLLRVQRSQSDVTAMKSVVDKLDTSDSKSPRHGRMNSESDNSKDKMCSQPSNAEGKSRQTSWRKNRPTRKAPPPPQKVPPVQVTPASPGITLESVVPLDSRVKSMHLSKKPKNRKGSAATALHDTTGSFYHSISDGDIGSSDGEHDYQDIPDDRDKDFDSGNSKNVKMTKGNLNRHEKSASPPKLPPRNLNNSHSFDNSSISSTGHDFDSAITGGASSNEDMSISSGCFDQDVTSPGFKNPHLMKSLYPKTSSPCVKTSLKTGSDENLMSSGLGPSNSSLSDSTEERKRRPVSGCSVQTDSWSGSHEAEQFSSDSDLDDEEKLSRKKEKKLFFIAQEIVSSENVFVDVLKLLNEDFRLSISQATEKNGRPVIPNEMLNRILDYLPQLQTFNEGLLKDLEERLKTWEERNGIADIFVKKGPFLKLFSSYIRDFETSTSTLDEALKKYPLFQAAVKEFELSPRCACLALKHYMLKPIQRIPQYRLLLQDYMKHLPEDSLEMKDMKTALAIVSEVATHANENMRHGDYVQKMLEIQRSLIGQFEIIKPGRIFLKEGELKKVSRKEMQPRYFFLFNDVLLYTTPVATGYRLNNVLPLAGMKVSVAAQDEYKMEFSIISVQRSFTLHGETLEERDDWVTALNAAIEENALKRNTFEAVRAGAQFWEEHLQKSWDTYQALLDKDFVLGHKAPLWIPDVRVTMCMLCTCEFTVTWRRHHCRACGWVVCGNCSDCKAPLRYLKYKSGRVCDKCYKTLKEAAEKEAKSEKPEAREKEEEDGGNLLSLNGLFERFQKIRRSGRTEKRTGVRPERLKEVSATDQGASMSGYLQRWVKGKRWKRKWYLIKDKVLYTFKATQDTAAADSMVLLGYEVSRFPEDYEGVEKDLLFQLSHANTDPVVFRTDSATATEKWVTVMRESTVA